MIQIDNNGIVLTGKCNDLYKSTLPNAIVVLDENNTPIHISEAFIKTMCMKYSTYVNINTRSNTYNNYFSKV